MTYLFHRGAEAGSPAAIDFNEDRKVDSAYDFSAEGSEVFQGIVNYPDTWPFVEDDVRRCHAGSFPFGVITVLKRAGICSQ
jgi:hypothetical protein